MGFSLFVGLVFAILFAVGISSAALVFLYTLLGYLCCFWVSVKGVFGLCGGGSGEKVFYVIYGVGCLVLLIAWVNVSMVPESCKVFPML